MKEYLLGIGALILIILAGSIVTGFSLNKFFDTGLPCLGGNDNAACIGTVGNSFTLGDFKVDSIPVSFWSVLVFFSLMLALASSGFWLLGLGIFALVILLNLLGMVLK